MRIVVQLNLENELHISQTDVATSEEFDRLLRALAVSARAVWPDYVWRIEKRKIISSPAEKNP
jgi:hypothetical protein